MKSKYAETKLDMVDMDNDSIAETREEDDDSPAKNRLFTSPLRSSPAHNMCPEEVNCWRKAAIGICWTSVIVTLALGIALFVISIQDSNMSAFASAFTASADVFTSLVVLWRYHGVSSAYSQRKEDKALVFCSLSFILSAICVIARGGYNFVYKVKPDLSPQAVSSLVLISIISSGMLFMLFLAKLIAARKLVSCSLLSDAFNSIAGAVISFSVVISVEISEYNPRYWFLDDIIGIIIGIALFAYGIALLAKYAPIVCRSSSYEEAE